MNAQSETYSYNLTTGNLASKAGMSLQYNDSAHVHAVTDAGGNTYSHDDNGNQITRDLGAQTYDLEYDAENRLVSVAMGGTGMNDQTQFAAQPASNGHFTSYNTSPLLQGGATDTPTPKPSKTPTPGATQTPSNTPVGTNTPSNTPVATNTPTATSAVTATNTPKPSKTPTPSITPTTPPQPTFSNATFTYNGDGRRVKSVITTNQGTTTTYFASPYYEVSNGVVIKYYMAGAQRVAVRTDGTLNYLLADHLGSTSVTTNASGGLVSELRYKPWGEVRLPVNGQNPGPSNYTFTGQYSDSYINLLWYGSRHYDPALGRFISPDSIVPTSVQGVQAWDRFAYANNAPTIYTDPTGHMIDDGGRDGGGGIRRINARVFYLNGLGGADNIPPFLDKDSEYKSTMYWLTRAVGSENVIHIPLFTKGSNQWLQRADMAGEALGLCPDWTNKALDMIRNELKENPLGENEKLVIVGSSAGGTVAAELLDDLEDGGIFVDQLIMRGSPVSQLNLTNVGEVDYIAAENPRSDLYYSIDVNPFDAVEVQEYRIPGLIQHTPQGLELMNKIGALIVDLIGK